MNLPGIRCGDVRQIGWFFHVGIDYLTLLAKSCLCEPSLTAYLVLWHTVLLKCKLTVLNWNSILDPRSFRESSFKARVSSFDFRGLRTNFWGLSFEFQDTQRIFRGSRTDIWRKQFNARKENSSDEQNNWDVLLVQTRCGMYANICLCCAFSTRHMWFTYLHWSWWLQTSRASKCAYNVSCQNELLFFHNYNLEQVCCFHLRDFNWLLKT